MQNSLFVLVVYSIGDGDDEVLTHGRQLKRGEVGEVERGGWSVTLALPLASLAPVALDSFLSRVRQGARYQADQSKEPRAFTWASEQASLRLHCNLYTILPP